MDLEDRVRRDQLLRNAVLGGDERAWQMWVGETFDDLYGYIRWRCGGLGDDVDDVVQETWLTAMRRLRRFNPPEGSFLAWLRGIAANVLRNRFRHRKTAPHRQSLDGDFVAETNQTETAQRERAERVAAVLCQLSKRHEAVLGAKYLEGLSVAQIAESWGETPKTVESLLTRARQSFQDAYRKFEQDGMGNP